MADGGGVEASHDGPGQGHPGDHLSLPRGHDGRGLRVQVSSIRGTGDCFYRAWFSFYARSLLPGAPARRSHSAVVSFLNSVVHARPTFGASVVQWFGHCAGVLACRFTGERL